MDGYQWGDTGMACPDKVCTAMRDRGLDADRIPAPLCEDGAFPSSKVRQVVFESAGGDAEHRSRLGYLMSSEGMRCHVVRRD